MLMRLIPVTLMLSLVACKPAAKEGASESFSVDDLEISIREVETPKDVLAAIESGALSQNPSRPQGEEAIGLVEIATIINLGKEVWDIVDKNKAVSNTSTDWASATPKGVASVEELAGFSNIVSKSYHMDAKNVMGITAFSLTYTLVHQYGGNYNGKGKYLASVSIVPSKVDTAWSYKLNLKTMKVQTTNVGTAENPIASLTMSMQAKLDGATKAREFNRVFQFRGDSASVTQIQ